MSKTFAMCGTGSDSKAAVALADVCHVTMMRMLVVGMHEVGMDD
jgi:hypothetical protein